MQTTEVPASLTTLLGGESVKVMLRDGSTRELFVRAVPLRLIGKWAELDSTGTPECESDLVSLYCALRNDEVDALTVEACEAVLAKGDALNRPTFARWQSRAANRAREWAQAGEATLALQRELNPAFVVSPPPPPNSASSSDGSQPK
jgi:hypothetical protein